jgi:hypothetical protein
VLSACRDVNGQRQNHNVSFSDVMQDASRQKYSRTWSQVLLFILRTQWKNERQVLHDVAELVDLFPYLKTPTALCQATLDSMTPYEDTGVALLRRILTHFTHRLWSASHDTVSFGEQLMVCIALQTKGTIMNPQEIGQTCSHLIFLVKCLSLAEFATTLRTPPLPEM